MRTVLRWLTAAVIVALAGCATYVPPPASPPTLAAAPLEGWATTLSRHVDIQGRVDFAAVKGDLAPLSAYLAYVAQISPESAPAQFPTRESRLG